MEKNKLIIKKASLDDINDILNIEKHLEHRFFTENTLKEDLIDKISHYFIAYKDNKAIGFIAFRDLAYTIDLDYIAVLEEHRKKKVGSFLFDSLLNYLKDNNIKGVMLEVRKSNDVALKFYENMGFKKISERKNYYKNPVEDAYILKMEK